MEGRERLAVLNSLARAALTSPKTKVVGVREILRSRRHALFLGKGTNSQATANNLSGCYMAGRLEILMGG